MIKIQDKKLSLPLIFGVLLSFLMILYWFYTYKTCNDDLGCIAFLMVPLFPSIVLNLEGTTSIIVSLIFWFLLGSLIGYLIYKVKNK